MSNNEDFDPWGLYTPRASPSRSPCSLPGCQQPTVKSRGGPYPSNIYCAHHARRLARFGHPLGGPLPVWMYKHWRRRLLKMLDPKARGFFRRLSPDGVPDGSRREGKSGAGQTFTFERVGAFPDANLALDAVKRVLAMQKPMLPPKTHSQAGRRLKRFHPPSLAWEWIQTLKAPPVGPRKQAHRTQVTPERILAEVIAVYTLLNTAPPSWWPTSAREQYRCENRAIGHAVLKLASRPIIGIKYGPPADPKKSLTATVQYLKRRKVPGSAAGYVGERLRRELAPWLGIILTTMNVER